MIQKIAAIPCHTYAQAEVDTAVTRIFKAFGGAAAIAKTGHRVCIKPNLLMPRKPEDATTTHPAVVSAVTRQFTALGCTVEIADSCGGPYNAAMSKLLYRKTGMAQVAEDTGAIIRYDGETTASEVPLAAGAARKFHIIQPIVDADVIINIAKLKTHGLGHYTGAVKNMYGVVAGLQKAKGHAAFKSRQEFFACLLDLYQHITPQFNIIDGIVGMEGDGPSGGTPRSANVLLGGIDGHVLDQFAVWLTHLDESKVFTLVDAQKRGILEDTPPRAPHDVERVRFRQPSTDKNSTIILRTLLPRRLRNYLRDRRMPYPHVIGAKCTGCADCRRICPEEAIEVAGKKAHILREKCIRCLCCHEVCPPKAMELKR
ncbi:MAG: DUF362 domain-containing protein [Oscillospiraceae bacterium]|nr:DUF362 domain-containing protein [Oscillospiraceae bacterium]